MFGYISSKELEYGLSQASFHASAQGNAPCTFRVAANARQGVSRVQSALATPAGYDLSWLVDSAPLTISSRSAMELCHEVSSFASLD